MEKCYSIRFKLTGILIIIVGFVIYFTWFLNVAFAEKYYISSEKTNIVHTFHQVKRILAKESSEWSLMKRWNSFPTAPILK